MFGFVKKTFLALFVVVLGGTLFAQNFPSLESDPAAAIYAERLSAKTQNYWRDLAEAALWASTVNAVNTAGAGQSALLERISAAVQTLNSAPDLPREPKERGEYVLKFIHKNFLTSYSEFQTRIDELLRSGRYNCVSSAVFYSIFAVSAGLDVQGVVTKDHAFVVLNTGRETIDVETTNVYGFDPGNRKEFQDGFGKATGFAYVPAGNYRARMTVELPELVSLILSNRVVETEKARRFADAVPLGINRSVLLSKSPDRSGGQELFEGSRADLMNRLFNYAIWLDQQKRDDEALAWIAYAEKRFPDAGWEGCRFPAMNNRLVALIQARKIADARTALEAEKARLSPENYRTLDVMVNAAEVTDLVNAIKNPGDVEAALARIQSLWDRLPEKNRDDMRTTALLKESERFGKTRDWAGALSWLTAAAEKYGSNARLENARRTFRQNRIGELHNAFAGLYNKGDYEGAKAQIQKALKEFPSEQQLRQDLALVERTLKNG